eukprot:scaffold529_cov322-Pavlova_lutheri.AAC.14
MHGCWGGNAIGDHTRRLQCRRTVLKRGKSEVLAFNLFWAFEDLQIGVFLCAPDLFNIGVEGRDGEPICRVSCEAFCIGVSSPGASKAGQLAGRLPSRSFAVPCCLFGKAVAGLLQTGVPDAGCFFQRKGWEWPSLVGRPGKAYVHGVTVSTTAVAGVLFHFEARQRSTLGMGPRVAVARKVSMTSTAEAFAIHVSAPHLPLDVSAFGR